MDLDFLVRSHFLASTEILAEKIGNLTQKIRIISISGIFVSRKKKSYVKISMAEVIKPYMPVKRPRTRF